MDCVLEWMISYRKIERLSENLAIFDFVLTEAEMAQIGSLAGRDGRIVDYAYSGPPKWD